MAASASEKPLHVAIIMDGNGRWATARALPRVHGHRKGATAVREVVTAAPDFGIGTLTLYAFSADNWRRPMTEVSYLMQLLDRYLSECTRACIDNGVRLEAIGRRDRLPVSLQRAIADAEQATSTGAQLHLRIAIDYSGRAAIRSAIQHLCGAACATFDEALARACHARDTIDVDLLIRPGGEKRLSDFLLWESAYAELVFTDCLWPDFGRAELALAIAEFQQRQRRFGGLGDRTLSTPALEIVHA